MRRPEAESMVNAIPVLWHLLLDSFRFQDPLLTSWWFLDSPGICAAVPGPPDTEEPATLNECVLDRAKSCFPRQVLKIPIGSTL